MARRRRSRLSYEMLTGTRAFEGEDVTDTLAALVAKDPDWSRLPAATPAAIRRLLRRCLTKPVNERLRSMGDAKLHIADGERADDDAVTAAPIG